MSSRTVEERLAGLERYVMEMNDELYPLRKMRNDLKHEVDELRARLDAIEKAP